MLECGTFRKKPLLWKVHKRSGIRRGCEVLGLAVYLYIPCRLTDSCFQIMQAGSINQQFGANKIFQLCEISVF